MLKVAIIFDRDLTSKGRDLPELHQKGTQKRKDPGAPVRAPRPDAKKHLLPEAKNPNPLDEPKIVLKKSSLKIARPVPIESMQEDQDMKFRSENIQNTMSDLDSYLSDEEKDLIDYNQGRQEWEDEFGTSHPLDNSQEKDAYQSNLNASRQDWKDEYGSESQANWHPIGM